MQRLRTPSKTEIVQFVTEKKSYLLVVSLTIIFMIALIVLFNPAKQRFTDLLSKKQVKQLQKENAELKALNQREIDSALYYKHLAEQYTQVIDSSKTVTVYIKQQTNEEVNNIRFAPIDSNIIKFESDLEEYITTR